jgi:hypothetical protein
MLDGFIIEELKRRERERSERKRPVLEVPLRDDREDDDDDDRRSDIQDTPQRGVVTIDV